MRSLKVAILASDVDQRDLKSQVESTGLARVVHGSSALPRFVEDAKYPNLRDSKPEVVLIDMPADTNAAIATVEFLRAEMPEALLVPMGDTSKPHVIVGVMRAGAGEFLERPVSAEHLREAFTRHLKQCDKRNGDSRGKVICFVNGKGGSGATTAAVNTALALADKGGPVVLLELAAPGGACLHLNVNPKFSLADAFRNFHRMDFALLEGFMTDCGDGLQLLAGPEDPLETASSEDIAKLLDALAASFRYVIVDASSRIDDLTRRICDFADQVILVAQPEVGSLWSTAKVRKYVAGPAKDKRVGLLLNRYRKMPGLENEHIETAVGCKILWTIQNQYISIARSIENGTPVARDQRSEMARAFAALAAIIMGEKPALPSEQKSRGKVFDKLTGARAYSY